jgi:hypothetical protein
MAFGESPGLGRSYGAVGLSETLFASDMGKDKRALEVVLMECL